MSRLTETRLCSCRKSLLTWYHLIDTMSGSPAPWKQGTLDLQWTSETEEPRASRHTHTLSVCVDRPKNGSIILYNRKKVKYRKDGYCWKKRKDGKTTREDHMKLKVQGMEVCSTRTYPQCHCSSLKTLTALLTQMSWANVGIFWMMWNWILNLILSSECVHLHPILYFLCVIDNGHWIIVQHNVTLIKYWFSKDHNVLASWVCLMQRICSSSDECYANQS